MKTEMTLRELLQYSENTDVDVCDDYDESCYLAVVGKYEITPYCEGKYELALDLKVECEMEDGEITDALLIVNGTGNDDVWCAYRVGLATKLLYAAAGYCSCEEYKKLFNEEA